jgi:hypothetical protein
MIRLSRPSPGYERLFYRCKKRGCKRVFYYDYVPYSLANPVLVQPCGHNIGEKEKIFGTEITKREFCVALTNEIRVHVIKDRKSAGAPSKRSRR